MGGEVLVRTVLIKLTPNIGDILEPGVAAVEAGVHGLSLINTIKSIVGVDLDKMVPYPVVGKRSTNGGYCGPAVKPIALHMVAALARDPRRHRADLGHRRHRHLARRGGVHRAGVHQRAGMHRGHALRVPHRRGHDRGTLELPGREGHEVGERAAREGAAAYSEWGDLDLNYKVAAQIDPEKCIGCDLCYVACRDTSVHCIHVDGHPLAEGHRAPTRDAAGPSRPPAA
jgi:dihydropyrimidine dehydrogenase (NAD+) subunit PreA